ncbi:MAG: nitroreductase family protein [Saprospiraceae bacterium]|jgi:nitroreductase|nr:nitroreductase family protein [Saprospiraceae bacterium]
MISETIKLANPERPIHDLIRSRWSARSFSEKAIAQSDLETILEAASWAFSANNSQPWHYIYAHHADTEAFQKIWSCLMPGNQPWCANAAVLIVSCIHKVNESGKPNNWAMHDLGAANATLMLQATAMGLHGHPMAGFDKAKTIETFNINADILEPVAFLALGYLDEAEKLEEPFKTRELTPRSRKGVSEISERLG